MLLVLLFTLFFSVSAHTGEGFYPSEERNVVMLKGSTSGGTAFIMNGPTKEKVLVTQLHVIEGHKKPLTIQWGYEVGPFFRLKQIHSEAFQFDYTAEIIWSDRELDIAVLKMPKQLLQLCKCTGFDSGDFVEGPSSLIGYPILERRIWPQTNSFVWMWKELWGHVQQKTSHGKVWKSQEEYLGDIDALSGNSGGPLIQNGKAIGVIHMLKTWKGEGYRYKNPSLNFIPIQAVTEALKKQN